MRSRPNPSRQPQTLLLDHAYTEPPHCKAKSKQTILQMRKNAPARSICLILSLTVMEAYDRGGLLKKKNTTAILTAPNGRLIHFVGEIR